VLPSLQTRNKKLAENVKKHVGLSYLRAETGRVQVPTISIPSDRANNFLVRLTKGLLWHFYPEYDYSKVGFKVMNVAPIRKHIATIAQLTTVLIPDSRGDTVFRFWRGLVSDSPDTGAWVFLFYEAACLTVYHGPQFK
jgi:hypothetical protein